MTANTHGKPGPGRPAGSPNKITGTLRGMVLGALDELGGQQWLIEQARSEPKAFMALLARLLPPAPPEDSGEVVIRITGGFSDE